MIVIVGAGIFGATAALELRRRGYPVSLLDPGPLPHPLAASTDISKVVRMEYGRDESYMALMEEAREGWLRWNGAFPDPLYHETGVTMFTREPMAPGGYEYESYHLLRKRGHSPERLSSHEIARRFPGWNPERYMDGFYHAKGGYAESGRVVMALVEQAQKEGVLLHQGQAVHRLLLAGGRVTGVQTTGGERFQADHVLVAAGAWTPVLLPEMAPHLQATGHPVFHLGVADPERFSPPHFAVFTADVSRTGWYGFPVHPREGVMKVAVHGVGLTLDPVRDERVVLPTDHERLRTFLRESFPALADAPVVYTRRCLYCDTRDEHLWIANHPQLAGLTVATGGSGHGFKFAPVLGDLTADAVEGVANPYLAKFRWRTLDDQTVGQEAARYHGEL